MMNPVKTLTKHKEQLVYRTSTYNVAGKLEADASTLASLQAQRSFPAQRRQRKRRLWRFFHGMAQPDRLLVLERIGQILRLERDRLDANRAQLGLRRGDAGFET